MAPLMSVLNKTFGAAKWIKQIDFRPLSDSAHDAPVMIKCTPMSTASARPQLQIRQAKEDDATPLCEIFNEAVQDHLETFDSEPRGVEAQRLRIAAADRDPKHPILVAELRNWVAGWAALEPYDGRIALDDIGEVYIYVRRAFRSYGVGRQLLRALQEAAGKLGDRKLI